MVLVISQITLVTVLLCIIYKKSVERRISLSPIRKEFVQFKEGDTLTFFYEPKPDTTETVRREWLTYSPTYHINSDSLNETKEYDQKKPEGVFRIITLGDSFTFGAYVDTKDNWTELLEDHLNRKYTCPSVAKYEVINLGMDGYDTAYEVERYIRRGQKYDPDLVVMLITDFGRVTEHRLSRKRTMPTLTIQQKEEYKRKGNFYPETNRFDNELTHEERVSYQEVHFKRLMEVYDKPLLLMDFSLNDSYRNDMKKLVMQYGSVTSVRMKLKRDDKRYILSDWHPNVNGHKKIMEEMVEQLKSKAFLPCK